MIGIIIYLLIGLILSIVMMILQFKDKSKITIGDLVFYLSMTVMWVYVIPIISIPGLVNKYYLYLDAVLVKIVHVIKKIWNVPILNASTTFSSIILNMLMLFEIGLLVISIILLIMFI